MSDLQLIDQGTGEVIEPCDPDRARDLTEKIKTSLGVAWELVKEAYQSRAWAALGYRSWDQYTAEEFGANRLRLPREERQEVVGSLRDAGMSVRAIAAATGSSYETTRRAIHAGDSFESPAESDGDEDWRCEHCNGVDSDDHDDPEDCHCNCGPDTGCDQAPRRITGTDGKTYRAKPAPKPKPVDPEAEQRERDEAERQSRADRLYRALEYLARHPVDPDEACKDVPDNQDFRVDEHLDAAQAWLDKFSAAWKSKRHGA